MDQRLQEKLSKRIKEGTLRSLSSFEGFVDLFSNDYLGFSKLKITDEFSTQYGSTGSRLISGTSVQALETEVFLADFFNSEAALVYNSGYDANLGFFSSVPQKGDTVFYDEYVHASIRDGVRLSFASNRSFKHNDVIDLEQKMLAVSGVKYVVIESIYSMDGDLAPLSVIAEICTRHNAYLIIDEAHACGVFEEHGKGLVASLNLESRVFARIITFGKAYGAHGACILGEQGLIEYLVNFSRSFMYTTALPPDSYARIKAIVSHPELQERKKQLHEVIKYFKKTIKTYDCYSDESSPIQLIRIGNIEQTKRLAEEIQKVKIAVKPIYSPTVPVGNEGIRICLHSFNTPKEIDLLMTILIKH